MPSARLYGVAVNALPLRTVVPGPALMGGPGTLVKGVSGL